MGAAPLILVADADHSCRKLITGLLGRIAFETTEAKTGPETLELVQRLRPALVLLEINLPEVSGYEVCRELRDDFGDEISVIFLSGERTTFSDRVATASWPPSTPCSPAGTRAAAAGRPLPSTRN
jgi:CheY-like chemotaxis protein